MATPINSSTRYFNRGITKCYFLPTIANYTSGPTRQELDAGTDLSGEIAEIEGWSVEGETIDTPDLATRYTSTIPGSINAEESSLTFYASSEGDDVRTLLPRDTEGYIVWLDGGDVENRKMDVYPVRVVSQSKARSLDDEAATITVTFAITAEPAENLTVPASAA